MKTHKKLSLKLLGTPGKNLFWAGVHGSKMNLQDKKTVLQGLSKGSQVRSFLYCINLNVHCLSFPKRIGKLYKVQ